MKPAKLLLLSLVALPGASLATVVNFDFNLNTGDNSNIGAGGTGDTYLGLGAAPDSVGNTHWNSVRRTSSGNVSSASALNSAVSGGGPIRDSSGTATTVDILLTSTTGVAGETNIGQQRSVGQQELGTVPDYEDLMADFLQLDAPGTDSAGNLGTINGTINGLIAGGIYEIFFYGQSTIYGTPGSTTSGANSFFAITDGLGGSVIGSGEQTGWDGTNGGDGALVEGIEYVKLTATANASGEIFFIWQNVMAGVNVATDAATDGTGGSSDLGSLNAIQIVSVPEPSAAFLGGLGLFGLVLRRRR
jgi:MYXO-CTERM domain-containing protein